MKRLVWAYFCVAFLFPFSACGLMPRPTIHEQVEQMYRNGEISHDQYRYVMNIVARAEMYCDVERRRYKAVQNAMTPSVPAGGGAGYAAAIGAFSAMNNRTESRGFYEDCMTQFLAVHLR